MTPYTDWRTRDGGDAFTEALAAYLQTEREIAEAHLSMVRDLRGMMENFDG